MTGINPEDKYKDPVKAMLEEKAARESAPDAQESADVSVSSSGATSDNESWSNSPEEKETSPLSDTTTSNSPPPTMEASPSPTENDYIPPVMGAPIPTAEEQSVINTHQPSDYRQENQPESNPESNSLSDDTYSKNHATNTSPAMFADPKSNILYDNPDGEGPLSISDLDNLPDLDGLIPGSRVQDNAQNESPVSDLKTESSTELIKIDTTDDMLPMGGLGGRDVDTNKDDKADEKPHVPMGQKLLDKGLISKDQLDIALKVQRDSSGNSMIGAILVEMGFITESALGEVLTESTGTNKFDPKASIIDPSLIKQVPKDVATRFQAVPILLEGDTIHIAMTDIYNVLAIDRIQRYFPKRFKMLPVHCSPAELSQIIDNYYDYELSIEGILREMEATRSDELMKLSTAQTGYTNPTVRLIDALLVDAVRTQASDLHFEPEGQFVRLRYRIDGKLRQIVSFHSDYWQAIAVRIKIISDMNITESRMPQDGRISCNVMGRTIDFRVATQPTIHGENIVMRVLDKEKALVPLSALGFSEPNLVMLKKALQRPEGIIVVTGPTGSGKTTTLYSILNFISKPDINIMTLEDPVEYQLPLIRQSNVREGTGMDFVGGIKSLMRQDPDIIFVGEVRDEATATMALRAAMTGHQVFTSLHTNDALGAIPRLIDIGVKPRVLAGSIIACIAQRLARKLCPKCKEERPATEEEVRVLELPTDTVTNLFIHKGCESCGYTGYKGRIGISEIILVDEGLDEEISQQGTHADMLRHIRTKGFIPMAEDGIEKVKQGVMDLPELIRTINMTDRL